MSFSKNERFIVLRVDGKNDSLEVFAPTPMTSKEAAQYTKDYPEDNLHDQLIIAELKLATKPYRGDYAHIPLLPESE
jgi:hypothetical protein